LNKLNNWGWFHVYCRNILDGPAEDSNTVKMKKASISRNRIPSLGSSIEELTLAVEEV
jgi:hypothetical protein